MRTDRKQNQIIHDLQLAINRLIAVRYYDRKRDPAIVVKYSFDRRVTKRVSLNYHVGDRSRSGGITANCIESLRPPSRLNRSRNLSSRNVDLEGSAYGDGEIEERSSCELGSKPSSVKRKRTSDGSVIA